MTGIIMFGIMGVGLYFLFRLRAFFIFHPIATVRRWWKGQKSGRREALGTLSVALAGTLGVGNVTGVAFCLLRGGAGSAFWMLISAAFAAALKFAESAVTVADRQDHKRRIGGMPYVIKNTLRHGGFLSSVYALLCLGAAFSMGAALQARAITETAQRLFDVPILPITTLVTALSVFLVRGGKKKIIKASEILVPLATFLYTALCFGVLLHNRHSLPGVFSTVLRDAFSLSSAAYGVGAFTAMKSVFRCAFAGISAGLLSNESGAGTSTLAHGGNLSSSPSEEGILGTFEILVDTVFLCSLTSVTLLSGGALSSSETAMALIDNTFSAVYGDVFRLPFFLSVFIFALATVICWFSYGEECRVFLFGKAHRGVYFLAFSVAVFFGGFLPTEKCIPLSDAFLSLLSVLCLLTLLKSGDTVKALAQKDGFLKKSEKSKKTLDKDG